MDQEMGIRDTSKDNCAQETVAATAGTKAQHILGME